MNRILAQAYILFLYLAMYMLQLICGTINGNI